MKRITNGLYILFLICISLKGQDVEVLIKEKPISFSGNINVRALFYNAKRIDNRQQPFSYVISGAPTINLYGISIPVSFIFSEQERSFRQSFNQFGLSPRYKWLTLHGGYRNITFSSFTLAGHTMMGGGVEMNPGIFRFGFMYGRLNRATTVDTTSGSLLPYSYNRKGYAVKIGIGSERNFLELSMIKAKDESSGTVIDFPTRNITPAENAAFGLRSRLTLFKNLYWEAEAGYSFYTHNINSTLSLDSTDVLPTVVENTLGRLMKINGSTAFYSAYQTGMMYKNRTLSLKLQYRRIDPGYQSMGAYFFNNDLENVTFSSSFTMFKQKFRFVGSIGIQRDNLQKQKQSTTNRVIAAVNTSLNITDFLGVDFTFNNFSSNQKSRTILLPDSFLLAQTTRNLSVMPRYILQTPGSNHIFLISYNNMSLTDLNSLTAEWNNMKSTNIFFNYQIYLIASSLNLSLNLNSTKLQMTTGEFSNKGVTAGISKKFFNKKLHVGFNTSVLQGIRGDQTSMILNNGLKIEMQAGKMHRFNLLANHIKNSPETKSVDSLYGSFTEIRGEVGYTFIF